MHLVRPGWRDSGGVGGVLETLDLYLDLWWHQVWLVRYGLWFCVGGLVLGLTASFCLLGMVSFSHRWY